MAGYYACITHIDHQVGRLITALENDGTYGNTVVVFTADHGEMLFDHSLFRKVLPYEGSTHIPLIVRVGKQLRAAHGAGPDCVGQRSQSVVELMDVMPRCSSLPAPPCRTRWTLLAGRGGARRASHRARLRPRRARARRGAVEPLHRDAARQVHLVLADGS